MIRAVIFDFDGLIVDTESPIFQAYSEIFREHDCELTFEDWERNVGRGISYDVWGRLEELVGHSLQKDVIDADRRARQLVLVESQPVLPGVRERIAEAESMGLKLAVASSSSRQWVAGHLDRHGLTHHFGALRTRTDPDVGVQKPDPAVYLAALRALGVAAQEAIALEDSILGVQAARTAGIFTVAIPNDVTRRMGDAGADLTLHSLADITLADIIQTAEQAHAARG